MKNYTTGIAVEKTVMEIEQLLVKFGAQLSLMEMEFADSVELFLPYAYNMVEDKTMYQKFLENKEKYLALESKEEKDGEN